MGVRQLEQVSNAKRFFEVFPTLKVEKDIQELFADVQIKKNYNKFFKRIFKYSSIQSASNSKTLYQTNGRTH